MLDLATPPTSVKVWAKSRPLIEILSQTAGPTTWRQHQLLLLPPGPAGQQPTLPQLENSEANPTDFRCTSPRTTAGAAPPAPRVRSHCRFRNRGTDYVREYGMKWMSFSTKRQCDRALPAPPPPARQPRRRPPRPPAAAPAPPRRPRPPPHLGIKSDCHFRKTATGYDSELGIKWLS
jgi:hypothetical protein